jgi:hypothetical protein
MMTLEQIQAALRDRRPRMVADATGLHYNTIREVRDNPKANPTYAVLRALSEYLSQREAVNG